MKKLSLSILIVMTVIISFAVGRMTIPESKSMVESISSQNQSTLDETIHLTPKEVKSKKTSRFIFPDDRSEQKSIQRQFLQLDHETRQIIFHIQNGDLEKVRSVYGVKVEVDENGRLQFEEMDLPELAISATLSKGTPLQLMNGYEEGDYFSFHYYYNPIGQDKSTDLFVQYKRDNDTWKLVNIRTNH